MIFLLIKVMYRPFLDTHRNDDTMNKGIKASQLKKEAQVVGSW